MKRWIGFGFFGVLTAALIALSGVPVLIVHAQDGSQPAGGVIMIDHYELHSGEVYNGNLIVLAREIDLQAGSHVMGSATLYASGSVTIGGEITGNLVVISPHAEVTAAVQGNVSLCTSNLTALSDQDIKGTVTIGCDLGAALSNVQQNVQQSAHSLGMGRQAVFPFADRRMQAERGDGFGYPLSRLFALLTTALATAALAGLGSAAFPRQMRRARDSILMRPATAALVGFLGAALALGVTIVYTLSLILMITIILMPVIILAWVVIGGLVFVGWLVIAEPVGRIILGRLHVYPVPMAAAAVGAFVMTLGVGLLMMIPCLGWIGSLGLVLISSAGLGSLILTRIGTQTYPPLAAPSVRLV